MQNEQPLSPWQANGAFASSVLRKVAWRLIPFICLLYMLNILDRSNIGFARLKMQDDLSMPKEVFDLGYGMFYVGYLLFEVPSNLLLRHVGARRWIARIMISWGAVSILTLAVTGPITFYLVRILLGVAEAGFFPGIIFYLTYWFPTRERAKMSAFFMAAIALASVLGNPVSGWILQDGDGLLGWKGWQWLFFLEGLPSVLLGWGTLYWLTDRPQDADWLSPGERAWLTQSLAKEEADRQQRHNPHPWAALLSGRVWLLIAVYFTVAVGSNAGSAYFPTILKERFPDVTPKGIGLLAALRHVCALLGMVLISTSSDRTGERRGHVAFSAVLAASGWSMVARTDTPTMALAGLCLAQTGMMSMLPTFWTLPTTFLSGAAAAAGIALINSVANIGGIFGASILGMLGPWTVAAILGVGAALALCVRRESTPGRATAGDAKHAERPF